MSTIQGKRVFCATVISQTATTEVLPAQFQTTTELMAYKQQGFFTLMSSIILGQLVQS